MKDYKENASRAKEKNKPRAQISASTYRITSLATSSTIKSKSRAMDDLVPLIFEAQYKWQVDESRQPFFHSGARGQLIMRNTNKSEYFTCLYVDRKTRSTFSSIDNRLAVTSLVARSFNWLRRCLRRGEAPQWQSAVPPWSQ